MIGQSEGLDTEIRAGGLGAEGEEHDLVVVRVDDFGEVFSELLEAC